MLGVLMKLIAGLLFVYWMGYGIGRIDGEGDTTPLSGIVIFLTLLSVVYCVLKGLELVP
jgi:hypothetical protein